MEVNINNLAAVPSIVFGLLGLAVFINFFGLPRSAPLVGGLVLTLMTLPVVIIASRAAIKAVPPSVREAALGIGASQMQMVFHHVLPLALPVDNNSFFYPSVNTSLVLTEAFGIKSDLLSFGKVRAAWSQSRHPGGCGRSGSRRLFRSHSSTHSPDRHFRGGCRV